jgi:WD40 repeat protein
MWSDSIGPKMLHDSYVSDAQLTPDEAHILTWSGDRTVRLWDIATGRQIGPVMKHDNEVRGARLFRNGTRVLSWSEDKTVRVWDISWRGGNLLEIACNHSPPDHDLAPVSRRYGVQLVDPICRSGKTIPLP